jgi:hypothetical protein
MTILVKLVINTRIAGAMLRTVSIKMMDMVLEALAVLVEPGAPFVLPPILILMLGITLFPVLTGASAAVATEAEISKKNIASIIIESFFFIIIYHSTDLRHYHCGIIHPRVAFGSKYAPFSHERLVERMSRDLLPRPVSPLLNS